MTKAIRFGGGRGAEPADDDLYDVAQSGQENPTAKPRVVVPGRRKSAGPAGTRMADLLPAEVIAVLTE